MLNTTAKNIKNVIKYIDLKDQIRIEIEKASTLKCNLAMDFDLLIALIGECLNLIIQIIIAILTLDFAAVFTEILNLVPLLFKLLYSAAIWKIKKDQLKIVDSKAPESEKKN